MKKQLILSLHTFHRNSQKHYTKTTTMMSISVIGDWYDDDDGYDDDGQLESSQLKRNVLQTHLSPR